MGKNCMNKKVLLLGDSIRIGYQEYVKRALANEYIVDYPSDNGRFCAYTYRYLGDWCGQGEYDIVHWNCGLWDIIRLIGDEACFTSAKGYMDYIQRIFLR